MDRIYLVGYMGSGKSTVGKILAEQLGWSFVDLDVVIEKRCGLSISELFRRYGENHFRDVESSALNTTIRLQQAVVATGGGAPCYNENIEVLKAHGRIIFLNGSPELLADRIVKDTSSRPIIQNMSHNDLVHFIAGHLEQRRSFYSQADITIDIDQSAIEVAHRISSILLSMDQ